MPRHTRDASGTGAISEGSADAGYLVISPVPAVNAYCPRRDDPEMRQLAEAGVVNVIGRMSNQVYVLA